MILIFTITATITKHNNLSTITDKDARTHTTPLQGGNMTNKENRWEAVEVSLDDIINYIDNDDFEGLSSLLTTEQGGAS